MAKDKTSFILYADQRSYFDKLSDDEAGRLIKHIFSYVNDENPNPIDRITDLSFEPIKLQLKRDLKKYQVVVDRNKQNGSLGGRPKKQQEPKKPNGLFDNPSKPKKADNDNDTDNDINNSLFDSVFDSFLVMRKQLKKPMTGKAIELLKSKLEKLAPADEQTQIEILEQSIMNNWQGVFPLKDSAKKEGANGILLKDCDFDILPIKDIHLVKYRTVVAFYKFFIKRAEKLNRKDDLNLLNSADLGIWMYDIDQIEKEHQFKPFDFYTIAIYLKEILYDEQLHFDSDSITSLKDLYGNYSNGKSRYLRVSRDAAKYIDKFDKFQFVNILIHKINGN